MLLIKKCRVFAPDDKGICDVLVAGEKVVRVAPDLVPLGNWDIQTIDGKGKLLLPGFIDAHVHIAGAGGEGGVATRTNEIRFTSLIRNGITTVAGCLGTDGITRHVDSVLMKAKALRALGMSAWIYTGAYQVPVPTLTGDIGRDIALIEEVIGVGEVAISDHRSSCPSTAELIRIASQARVAGMLTSKAGVVVLHMGDASDPFQPIHQAVHQSQLPYAQFVPTHCNRNAHIFRDTFDYARLGPVDLTSGAWAYFPEEEIKPSAAIAELIRAGIPIHHLTLSSDANGSLPLFDEKGKLVRLEVGGTESLFGEIVDAVSAGIPLDQAIRIITSNVADLLKLPGKGIIAEGADADLVMATDDLKIHSVVARGKTVMENGRLLVQDPFAKT